MLRMHQYTLRHRSCNNARSVLEMGSFVSVVSSAALMQKYEIGLYLLTAARALIIQWGTGACRN